MIVNTTEEAVSSRQNKALLQVSGQLFEVVCHRNAVSPFPPDHAFAAQIVEHGDE